MVGSMRSSDSPSASGNNGGLGGPNSNNSGNSNSSSSKGNSPSSGGDNGGLGGPTSNNSGNSGSRSSPSSSGNNGGLGGPTSNNSGNRSSSGGGSSPGGSGGNSNANGGGRGGVGGSNSPAGMNNSSLGGGNGGMNSAGNRASGAGPGASSNRSTTGGGYGSATGGGTSPSVGGMNSPRGMSNSSLGGSTNNASPTVGGQNSPAGMNNSTLGSGMASFNASQDKAKQADMAQQARASENQSMKDLAREKALGTISTAEVGKKDPYNTLSGGLIGDVVNMTVKDAIAFAKTQWQGKIKGANVLGAFQFKDTTLADVAAKMGLLDAKMTPAVQDQLAVGLMQERANKATVNGQIDVDKFAQEISKEWASVADPTTGVSHYAKNGIDKASISAATAREMAKDLVANGVVSPNKDVSSITSKDVSSVQTKAPGVDRFSSTYMGGATTTPTKSASTSQQNDPSGLPSGTYPGRVVGDGIAPSFAAPTKQAAAAPKTSAPTPPAPVSAPTPAPVRQRSLAEKVAAGAIDVGLGMMPGIGTPVSVINGGLALTGNKTLGERIAGSIATGEGGGAGSDSGADRLGGGNKDQSLKDTSTVPKKKEDTSFTDRYIAFVDNTPRPTPAQKWDYSTGYA